MKTRRILAASTAALLAFGSVAVVASANTDVTVTITKPANCATLTVADNADNAVNAGTVDFDSITSLVITATADEGYTVAKVTAKVNTGEPVEATLNTTTEKYEITTSALSLNDGDTLLITAVIEADEEEGGDEDDTTEVTLDADGEYDDLTTNLEYMIDEKYQDKLDESDDGWKIVATQSTPSAGDDGIDVTVAPFKDLPNTTKNSIKKLATSKAVIFDLSVLEGNKYNSKSPVPINFKYTGSVNGKVYHVKDKKLELVSSNNNKVRVNGSDYREITWTASNFSTYIIIDGDVKGASNASSSTTTSDGTTTTTTTTNPDTGIALAIAPVVLAAGAVAVVALKKKH